MRKAGITIIVAGTVITMAMAAVMPLPEGMSELTFAGALGGRRVQLIRQPTGLPLLAIRLLSSSSVS